MGEKRNGHDKEGDRIGVEKEEDRGGGQGN